ncbi:hypothetical protein GGH12_002854 [Coemansia sp. RSA 1822]|nr:hypothetical protein LPJ76_001779 [Coemansia sp. RSA 638]KAJ2562980.1 hypothetical protein GGH12_002854 [Coemansia sp. RSA 1822]
MDGQLYAPLLPPTPETPSAGQRQRTMQLHRGTGATPWTDKTVPWADRTQQPQAQITAAAGTQRLRLPKRRAMSAGRSSTSSYTAVETAEFSGIPEDSASIPEDSVSIDVRHVRGTRSMSAARGSIALSMTSRSSLSHRLSQGTQVTCGATSPTLPISTRPRFNSAMSAFGAARDSSSAYGGSTLGGSVYGGSAFDSSTFGGAELTIRLSVDAIQSRSYRMLLSGDAVLADLRHLEDEHQRAVSAAQAALGRRLIALYFAATWSADCDAFTPQLQSVAAAHGSDLTVVLVSLDHHPADMARMMAGTDWLCVPWREHARRRSLVERMDVSATDLPKLVIIDGNTHHVISVCGRADLERRPLTCVREWLKSRAGLSWWNKAKPWMLVGLASLLVWNLAVFMLASSFLE